MPLVPMLALGGFGLGLEALPSPADHRRVTDEDDVHRCGRCQAEFTALEDFVQHKLQKVCQRASQEALPATPAAAALLDQEVSYHPRTRTGVLPSSLSSPGSRKRRRGWHAGTDLCLWFPMTLGQAEGRHLISGEKGSGPYHQERGGALGFPGWPSHLWPKHGQLEPGVPPFL